jgi:hypothetical protein
MKIKGAYQRVHVKETIRALLEENCSILIDWGAQIGVSSEEGDIGLRWKRWDFSRYVTQNQMDLKKQKATRIGLVNFFHKISRTMPPNPNIYTAALLKGGPHLDYCEAMI